MLSEPMTSEAPIVARLEHVTKVYTTGSVQVVALDDVTLAIRKGEFVAVTGPSGSGKSTLMHILGCLDRATSGRVELEGRDISRVSANERAHLRNARIGFVFQAFNLLPRFTVQQNVELPLTYAGVGRKARARRAQELIALVGLADRAHHLPHQLSGGQRQRAAIARALINDPALIFADEPTGNLDSKTGAQILDLFAALHAQGRTIVMVTHDPDVAARATRRIALRDGRIIADTAA